MRRQLAISAHVFLSELTNQDKHRAACNQYLKGRTIRDLTKLVRLLFYCINYMTGKQKETPSKEQRALVMEAENVKTLAAVWRKLQGDVKEEGELGS